MIMRSVILISCACLLLSCAGKGKLFGVEFDYDTEIYTKWEDSDRDLKFDPNDEFNYIRERR
jgi:hypothetical protein